MEKEALTRTAVVEQEKKQLKQVENQSKYGTSIWRKRKTDVIFHTLRDYVILLGLQQFS